MEKANKPLPLDDRRGTWHTYVSYEGHEAVVQRVTHELQKLAVEENAVQGGELAVTTDAQLVACCARPSTGCAGALRW